MNLIVIFKQGESNTEVLARYKGEVAYQACQGCHSHYAVLPELPHEELDDGCSGDLQECQKGPRAWPMVSLACNSSCFTG